MKKNLFEKNNFVLFGISLVLLAVGYILLAQGPADNHLSKSVAPAILVFVYGGLLPYSILSGYLKAGKKENKGK
ncbi:hypothetical protein CHISP_2224 [Chitinispirillum alkaliphilum]|nr:hypothetical protein CHISP_2224 [Chitinispirillum alkaliphilum]